jgi:hypothetical protein
MLMRRLTASIKTSNSSKSGYRLALAPMRRRQNSPRHLRGQPIDSQSDRSRQMVENDFSPPLRERGSFSRRSLSPFA